MNGEQYPPVHKKQAPGQLPIPAAEGLPPGTQALPTAISMLLTAGPLKTGATWTILQNKHNRISNTFCLSAAQ